MRPRPVIPGTTYLITRGCIDQRFLLLPSRAVEEVVLYCVAVAASSTGVVVHALTVMSNHYHAVTSDPFGRAPEFYGWVNEFVAKALNCSYGRSGPFWQPNVPTSRVELIDDDAVVDKVAYAAANPVLSRLVSRGELWSGVRLYRPEMRVVARPSVFFREDGDLPKTAILHIVAPKLASSRSESETLERIDSAVLAKEAAARDEASREGKRFVGLRRLRRQTIHDTPLTKRARFGMSPGVASRNKWLRLERLRQCRQWLADHRAASKQWREGARDVVFPFGTYAMVRFHAVSVASP
jgi:hypothetical protein